MRGLSIVAADGSSATLVTGTPKVYADSELRGTTYAGMGWMHEVELHPDYAKNGWIYLSFGDRCEDCNTASRATDRPVVMVKLVRGRLKGSVWVDQQTIWEAPKETYQDGLENGSGARISFDAAGHVFLTVGMFVDYAGVQNLDRPYGKIIRVYDDGRIPADNPFVDVPSALPGIYTLGHRVPQGIAFDRATGRVWATEHGPRGGDECNLIRPGVNYGWPVISEGVDYDGRPIHYAEELGLDGRFGDPRASEAVLDAVAGGLEPGLLPGGRVPEMAGPGDHRDAREERPLALCARRERRGRARDADRRPRTLPRRRGRTEGRDRRPAGAPRRQPDPPPRAGGLTRRRGAPGAAAVAAARA